MLGTLGSTVSARTAGRSLPNPDRRIPGTQPCTQCVRTNLTPKLGSSWVLAQRAAAVTCAAKPAQVRGGGEAASSQNTSSRGNQEREAAEVATQQDLDGDGFLDDQDVEYDEDDEAEYGEDGEEEEEEDEEGDGGDDYAAAFLEPDDAPREVLTGDTSWGEVVLRATKEVLAQPAMKGLELYLFRALPSSRKVDIRLDKLDDLYGSPSIDDIEKFQRSLFAALDRELGVEAAGEISFEVSSPGAERVVRVPDELQRFSELPLRVEYRGSDGKDAALVLVLAELDEQAGSTVWRLANVRANAPVKGRALSKKQLSQRITIPLADITRVRIHVDF